MHWNWRAEVMWRPIPRVNSVYGRRHWDNGDQRHTARVDQNLRSAARFYTGEFALIMVASLIEGLMVAGLTAIFMLVMATGTTGFNSRCVARLQTERVRMMEATPARQMREHHDHRNSTHHAVHDRFPI